MSANTKTESGAVDAQRKPLSFSIATLLAGSDKPDNHSNRTTAATVAAPEFTVLPIYQSTPKAPTKADYDRYRDATRNELLKQSFELALTAASPSPPAADNEVSAYRDYVASDSASNDSSSRSSRFSPVTSGDVTSSRDDRRQKKARTSFNAMQLRELEMRYERQRYIAAAERSVLARSLRLSDQQVSGSNLSRIQQQ